MASRDIAAALQRAEGVMRRRPRLGLHDDASATARWVGGTRIVAQHANGTQVPTDMPTELGGSGDQVSPGWLLRAGFASCTATCIAMIAARKGIELESLEVFVGSRSDTRGMLQMPECDGSPVYAGPQAMRLVVKISAPAVPAERLRTLVDESYRASPMTRAVTDAIAVALCIEVSEAPRDLRGETAEAMQAV